MKKLTRKQLLEIVNNMIPDTWGQRRTIVRVGDGTVKRCVWGQAMHDILGMDDDTIAPFQWEPQISRVFEDAGYDVSRQLVADLAAINDNSATFETFKRAATMLLRDGDRKRAFQVVQDSWGSMKTWITM